MNRIVEEGIRDGDVMRSPTDYERDKYNFEELQKWHAWLWKLKQSGGIIWRDFMMITILIWYGRRATEVLSLRVQDVDFEKGVIYFRQLKKRTESKRIKTIHIMKKVEPYLKEYCDYCKRLKMYWLFESPRNPEKHLQRRTLDYIVYKYSEMYFKKHDNTPMRLWPHFFRHIITDWMLQKTGDWDLVYNYFGHNDPKTTQRYRRSTPEQVKEQVPDLLK